MKIIGREVLRFSVRYALVAVSVTAYCSWWLSQILLPDALLAWFLLHVVLTRACFRMGRYAVQAGLHDLAVSFAEQNGGRLTSFDPDTLVCHYVKKERPDGSRVETG